MGILSLYQGWVGTGLPGRVHREFGGQGTLQPYTGWKKNPVPLGGLQVRTATADYKALGITTIPPCRSSILPAIADTGCQSCVAGIRVVQRLGISHADLIPVTI